MSRQDLARIMLEGALNGIGFVIGTAVVGWFVSFLFLHFIALTILPLIGVVLWFGFKWSRAVKDRLERIRVDGSTRALEKQ
jgi:uncharacterized membrane protein